MVCESLDLALRLACAPPATALLAPLWEVSCIDLRQALDTCFRALHDADVGDDERGVERGRNPQPLQENTQTHAPAAQRLHVSQLLRPGGVHLPGS